MLAVDSLCQRHEQVEAEILQHAEHQRTLMDKQHIQTLFWDEIGGPLKVDEVSYFVAAAVASRHMYK